MGSVTKVLAKRLARFGLLNAIVLLFVVPAALAQQAPRGDELLGTDGTLIPDFDRGAAQGQDDLFDNPEPTAPARVFEPQDPLNTTYANQSSDAIDRTANERLNTSLPDPLTQPPREFRDDRFNRRLVQDAQSRSGEAGTGQAGPGQSETGDWRARDDAAFDPLGIRMASFVFYPELYSRLITTNNLFASSSNQKSDAALEFTPTFRLRSDWNRHELEFFATATRTNWRNFGAQNTTEYETRVRGRVDITSRTSVEGGVRFAQEMEIGSAPTATTGAGKPTKERELEIFGQINHRFNRLGFRLRGQQIRNYFEATPAIGAGATTGNSRDYDEQQLALRTNYEFSPRFSLFADTGVGRRKFQHRLDGGGLQQGSKSWLAAVGASVEFTSNLNFIGRVGYAKATPNEPSLVDLEGVVYDAALVWTPTRLITLTLNGKTEIEETSQAGSLGSINRSVSFELVNSWTHRLSSTVTGEYEVKDFAGIDQSDEELTIGVGVEYLFARSWVLDAGYEHKLVEGTTSYHEDQLHLGLKWRR